MAENYPIDWIYVVDNMEKGEKRNCHRLQNLSFEYQIDLIQILIKLIEDRNKEIVPEGKIFKNAIEYDGVNYSYQYFKKVNKDDPTKFIISISITTKKPKQAITVFICPPDPDPEKSIIMDELLDQRRKTGHKFILKGSGVGNIRFGGDIAELNDIQTMLRTTSKLSPGSHQGYLISTVDMYFKAIEMYDEIINQRISDIINGTAEIDDEEFLEFLENLKTSGFEFPIESMKPYGEKVEEYRKSYCSYINCLTIIFKLIKQGKALNLESQLEKCKLRKPVTRPVDIYRSCYNPECEHIDSRFHCRRCEKTYYCSHECQSADWERHAEVCKKIEKGSKGGRSKRKRAKKKKSYSRSKIFFLT